MLFHYVFHMQWNHYIVGHKLLLLNTFNAKGCYAESVYGVLNDCRISWNIINNLNNIFFCF